MFAQWRRQALLLLVCVLFASLRAFATCDPNITPTVSLTVGAWQRTNAVLPVTVSVNPYRTDGSTESVYFYFDSIGPTPVAHIYIAADPVSVNLNTSCLPTGAHSVIAVGVYCGHSGQTSAGFTVDSTPTLSAAFLNGFDANGNGTLTITYDFPNANQSSQGIIIIERDGVQLFSTWAQPLTGSFTATESITCLSSGTHNFTVRARPCGDSTRDVVVTIPVVVDTAPQLTLTMSDPDANGNISISGTVGFPNSPAGGMFAGETFIYVDDEPTARRHDSYYQTSGGFGYTLNVTCHGPYHVRVVAKSCSQETTSKDAYGGTPGMTNPRVTLDDLGPDQSGNRA